MQRLALALTSQLCLIACGGGGGGSDRSGVDPRLARLDAYEAQKLRVLGDPAAGVMGMPITAAEDVPHSGAMMFEGSGTMRVETDQVALVLFGDAQLQVDFVSGASTGDITRTFGTNSDGDVVNYSGAIEMQGTTATQNMPLNYQGTLRAGEEVLGFDGTMVGVFLGNPTTAFTAADLEAEIDQGGVERSGTVVVTMEEVPPS